MLSDLRVALYVCWAVAIVYSGTKHAEVDYVAWLASYHIVNILTLAVERAIESRRTRDYINGYRALGAAEREKMVARVWSGGARVRLRQALDDDLVATAEDGIERFPLPNSYRRRITVTFWIATVGAAAALVLPIVGFVPGRAGWFSLALGTVVLFAMARLRRLRTAADSVVEITDYGIALVSSRGQRSAVHWASGVGLENHPRARRIDLIDLTSGKRLPVSYATSGVMRIVDLVVQHAQSVSTEIR